VQDDGHAGLGDLPGGFGTGQAATDYMNGFHSHARLFRRFRIPRGRAPFVDSGAAMAGRLSLRHSLMEAGRFALTAWRAAPVACGLMILALLFPVVLAGGVPDLWVALPLVVVQVAAMLLGWTGLLRAAQGRLGLAGIGA
jgi:hypothetical protein